MSLSPGPTRLLSAPPSKAKQTWAYSPGQEISHSVPSSALLSFPPVILWSVLGASWEGLEIPSPPPHTGAGTSLGYDAPPFPGCLLKPFKLSPLRFA